MAPYDRALAEEAFEAARTERARMVARALASLFEGVGHFFRAMSERAYPAQAEERSPLPTS